MPLHFVIPTSVFYHTSEVVAMFPYSENDDCKENVNLRKTMIIQGI